MIKFIHIILIASFYLSCLICVENDSTKYLYNIKKEYKNKREILYQKLYKIENYTISINTSGKKYKSSIKSNDPNYYNEIKPKLKKALSLILSSDDVKEKMNNFTEIFLHGDYPLKREYTDFFNEIYAIFESYSDQKFNQTIENLAYILYYIKVTNLAKKYALEKLIQEFPDIEKEILRFQHIKKLKKGVNYAKTIYKKEKELAKIEFKRNYSFVKANIKKAINIAIDSHNIKNDLSDLARMHLSIVTRPNIIMDQTIRTYNEKEEEIHDKFNDIVNDNLSEEPTEDLFKNLPEGSNNYWYPDDLITSMKEYKIITFMYEEFINHLEAHFKEKTDVI